MNQATLQTAPNYQAYFGNYQAPPTAVKYHTKCLDSGQVPTCNYSSIVACIAYLQACSQANFGLRFPRRYLTIDSPPEIARGALLGTEHDTLACFALDGECGSGGCSLRL